MWRITILNSTPGSTRRIFNLVVFAGGYLFGLYLVYIGYYLKVWQGWNHYGYFVDTWIVLGLTYPWIAYLMGDVPLWMPLLYGMYAVVAYKRLQRLGLLLFVAHYVLAVLFVGFMYLYAESESDDVPILVVMFKHPMPLLYYLPFVFGNLWYLQRLRFNKPKGKIGQ